MAAYGSGAAQRSIRDGAVMNIDVGGGTSKIAVCPDGKVVDLTALDVGARLVVSMPDGKIVRLEEAGRRFGADSGWNSSSASCFTTERASARGAWPSGCSRRCSAARRRAGATPAAPRSACPSRQHRRGHVFRRRVGIRLWQRGRISAISARSSRPKSARASKRLGTEAGAPDEGIRATVIGASQYTTQVSGSTIFVWPLEILPLRNVPVIAPDLASTTRRSIRAAVARSIKAC